MLITTLNRVAVVSVSVGSILATATTAVSATWTYTNRQNGLLNATTNIGVNVNATPVLQALPGTNIFPAQSFSPGYSPNIQESTSSPPDILTGTPSNPVYLKQFRIGNFNNADRQLLIFEQLQPNVALKLAKPNQLLSLSVGATVDLNNDHQNDLRLLGIGSAGQAAGVYSFGNGLSLTSGISGSYFALATAAPNTTIDLQTQIEVSELAITANSLNKTGVPSAALTVLNTVLPKTIRSGGYGGGVGYLSSNILNTYNPTVGVNPNLSVKTPILGNVAVSGQVDAGFDWVFEAQFANEPEKGLTFAGETNPFDEPSDPLFAPKLFEVEGRVGAKAGADYEFAIGLEGANQTNTGQIYRDWLNGTNLPWQLNWNQATGRASFKIGSEEIFYPLTTPGPNAGKIFNNFGLILNAKTDADVVDPNTTISLGITSINGSALKFIGNPPSTCAVPNSILLNAISPATGGSSVECYFTSTDPITSLAGTAKIAWTGTDPTRRGRSRVTFKIKGYDPDPLDSNIAQSVPEPSSVLGLLTITLGSRLILKGKRKVNNLKSKNI